MRIYKYIFLLVAGIMLTGILTAQTVLFNNGTLTRLNPGCVVYVQNGDVKNQYGTLKNAGQLRVQQHFINNDTATGGGANGLYEIAGNWENNFVFIPDQSEVMLYGNDQLITGDSITSFYDLNLSGTGVKSQNLDARVLHTLNLNDRELATSSHVMFVDNTDPNAVVENGGFVSSTDDGRLSRATNLVTSYYYPVGSSTGTFRIRPVQLTPNQADGSVYAVRMANVDPTTEGYDRSTAAQEVCEINDQFYHLIDRSSGNAAADISLLYDQTSDGVWEGIGQWKNVPQWENTANATSGTSLGYDMLRISGWNDFTYPAFALIKFGEIPFITHQGNTLSTTAIGASYQWYFNGDPIPGATDPTYTITESGTYWLEVTYGDGCVGISNTLELSLSSLAEILGIKALNLFPNPGNGHFTIQLEMEQAQDITLEFTDVLGRQIRPAMRFTKTYGFAENINISTHARGVYFIRIITNEGQKNLRYIND